MDRDVDPGGRGGLHVGHRDWQAREACLLDRCDEIGGQRDLARARLIASSQTVAAET